MVSRYLPFVCPPHMDDGLVSARQCDKPTQAKRLEQPARSGSGGRLLCARRACAADCSEVSGINGYIGRITLRQTGLRILQFKAPVPIAGEIDANLQIPRGGRGIPRVSLAFSSASMAQPAPAPARPAPRPARGGATDPAGRRHSRPAGRQSTFAPRRRLPQRHVVRPLPGRPETAGGRRRRVAADACRSFALPRLRPGHRQPRPRPARVRAGVHRIRRPHGRDLPDAAGPGANQDACGGVRARREGIWRAAGGDRRVLGAGERFRRQHGQSADAALAGVAGL